MKKSVIVLVVLFVAVGVFANFRSSLSGYVRPNEDEIEKLVPPTVDGYTYRPGPGDPYHSYKMDEVTYDMLKPFGIVGRTYIKNDEVIDAVLIASDDPDSFHDQEWCFRGQDWTINSREVVQVPTKEFGNIPFVQLNMTNKNGFTTYAMFTFKGPEHKFFSSFSDMWFDFTVRGLTRGTPPQGSFYRFIAGSQAVTKEKLEAFAANYVDETHRFSKGKV